MVRSTKSVSLESSAKKLEILEVPKTKKLQILFAEFAVQKSLKRYTEVAKLLLLEAEIGESTAFATDAPYYLKTLKNFQETGHKLILIF